MTLLTLKLNLKKNASLSNLRHRAVAVYFQLVDLMDEYMTCFPSIRYIASKIKLSFATVKRALRELKEEGFIRSQARTRSAGGSQTSNLYTISKVEEIAAVKSEYETELLDTEETKVEAAEKEKVQEIIASDLPYAEAVKKLEEIYVQRNVITDTEEESAEEDHIDVFPQFVECHTHNLDKTRVSHKTRNVTIKSLVAIFVLLFFMTLFVTNSNHISKNVNIHTYSNEFDMVGGQIELP